MKLLLSSLWRNFRNTPWPFLFEGLVALIASKLTADIVNGHEVLTWLPFAHTYPGFVKATVVLLLILLTWHLYHQRYRLLGVRLLTRGRARPRKGLIWTLSPPRGGTPSLGSGGALVISNQGQGYTLTWDLDRDIRALSSCPALKGWNWLQLMHALRVHKGKLKAIYFVVSDQSEEYFDRAAVMAKKYVNNINIYQSRPLNFLEVDEAYEAFREAVKELRDKEGLPLSEITIDVTGGLKPASIAGAMATLFEGVTFEYVTESYDVESFDVTVRHTERP